MDDSIDTVLCNSDKNPKVYLDMSKVFTISSDKGVIVI